MKPEIPVSLHKLYDQLNKRQQKQDRILGLAITLVVVAVYGLIAHYYGLI